MQQSSLIVYRAFQWPKQTAQSASSRALTALDVFDKFHEKAHSE